MKISRPALFSGCFLALLPFSASAFVETFSGSPWTTLNMHIDGNDGWTISDTSTYSDGTGISYLNTMSDMQGNIVNAGEIGGYNTYPAASPPTTVYLSHAITVPLDTSSFQTLFAIQSSASAEGTPNPQYPGRDGFGFSLLDSTSNKLVTVSFSPAANNTYEVDYSVGSNAAVPAHDANGSLMYINQDATYNLSVAFAPSGNDAQFTATIQGGVSSDSFTATAAGLHAANVASFAADWNTLVDQEGSNGLEFTNLSVVPEPSTALLAGTALLGLLCRRRTI